VKKTRPGPSRPRFEDLLVDISTRFIALPPERIDSEILRAQREVCECLGLDISSLWQMSPDDPRDLVSSHVYVPPDYLVPVLEMEAQDFFPWSMARLARGETVVLSRMTDIPPEGARDLEIFRYYKIRSSITFPLSAGGGPVFGAVAFDTFRRQRTWSPGLIDKLGLVAQVFAHALFRRRAERRLLENEARYGEVFENSLEGIFRTSAEGRVLFLNPAMAAILGFDSPEEVARSIKDTGSQVWAVPDERSIFVRRLETEGAIRGYECRIRRKDGTPIWVSLSVRPIKGPEGRIAWFDGFAKDIDERKRAESALGETEGRFRTLFELAPAGICVAGADGHVHTANTLQARLYGYESPKELEGFFAPLFIAERDRERAAGDFAAWTESDDTTERVYTAVRRDGSEFPVEVKAVVLRGPDRSAQGYLLLTRDLTKSRQEEREKDELRLELTHLARVLTIDQISTSLAHEINQPLGAILNNAEAARTLLVRAPDKGADLSEIVEDIIRDAKRAGDIIRKVRGLVKREPVSFEPLSANALIDETVDIVRNNLALNGVTLRLEKAPDLADVWGDYTRLKQVLLNLVNNAIDAMKGVPSRTLTVRSAVSGPDTVVVSVSDSGHGVVETGRDRLFDAFFTTKKDGLGLGLSICRSIIEEHGGRIWLADNPGGGSTFSFSLKTPRGDPSAIR